MIFLNKPLVFFYHHIRPKEFLTDLSVSISSFEEQLKYIVTKGYQTIFASDLVERYSENKTLRKTIVLTFDDGYVDNYLYAYPLLVKYGLKATIFVVTGLISDRIQNSCINLYSTHDEINRSWARNADTSSHFLSWKEMKEMVSSGCIEFQSHGHSHGRQFISDEPIGIATKIKPWFLPLCTGGDEREGIPLFPTGSVLSSRRFTVHKEILDHCSQKYNECKNLPSDEVSKIIINCVKLKKQKESIAEIESKKDYETRIRGELKTSINLLTSNIGKRPTILAYPWGLFNKDLIRIAKKMDFKGAFTMQPPKNNILDKIYSLKRIQANDSLKSFKHSIMMNSYPLSLLRCLKNRVRF